MPVSATQLGQLLYKHLTGNLGAEERVMLEEWLQEHPENQQLFNRWTSRSGLQEGVGRQMIIRDRAPLVLDRILQEITPQPLQVVRKNNMRRWYLAAASLLCILAVAGYFGIIRNGQPGVTTASTHDSAASRNVVLQLADGSSVVLDSNANGQLAIQGNVLRSSNGQLVYILSDSASAVPLYNTVTTPRGTQFTLTLADGSKVWLNAASSIRFPSGFGKERRVTITGEAYFEIAQDAAHPFIVSAADMEMKVLGTCFNVNVYTNETIARTTLVSGKLQVSNNGSTMLLLPGEQAYRTSSTSLQKRPADTDKEIAWMKGLFNFEDVSLEEIMRQLERWYDIEVVYQGKIPTRTFWGEISRSATLDDVLYALKGYGIHCKKEGRKVIVLQ